MREALMSPVVVMTRAEQLEPDAPPGDERWGGRPDPDPPGIRCPVCDAWVAPLCTRRAGEWHAVCPACGAEDVWPGGAPCGG